jgi:hypothetical protein
MPAAEHRYGDCVVIAQARLNGGQLVRVQGVTAMASRNRSEHLAVTVGRLLLILEDRAALNAVRDAVDRAEKLADDVFGAETDEFTWAERAERARLAKHGLPPTH